MIVSPETWYLIWALVFIGIIVVLALARREVGRAWREHCGDEPRSEDVVNAGNRLYDGLKEAGVETPSNFSGYKVARDVIDVRRRLWDNQQVAIVTGAAFVAGLSIGLVF